MRIEHLKSHGIGEDMVEELDWLHFREGMMWPLFRYHSKEGGKDSDVFLCFVAGKILGWAHVFSTFGRMEIHIYVDHRHRRKGIGSALYKEAEKKCGQMTVHKWDRKSREFYNKMGA